MSGPDTTAGAFRLNMSDPLGVWQPAPMAAESFALDAAPVAAQTVWTADLPTAPAEAAAVLRERERQLRAAEQQINVAAARLRSFSQLGGATALADSFGLEATPAPEQHLAAWVAANRGGASFFPGEQLVADLRQAASEAQAFFAQVRTAVSNMALVQTSFDGAVAARTRVGWSGDFDTQGHTGLPAAQAEAHRKALALALNSRIAWLRLAFVLMAGAAQLAALAGTSLVGAIPAAWRFLNEVRQALQALNPSATS